MSWPVDDKKTRIDHLEYAKDIVNTDVAVAQVHALIAIGELLSEMQERQSRDEYHDEYGAV